MDICRSWLLDADEVVPCVCWLLYAKFSIEEVIVFVNETYYKLKRNEERGTYAAVLLRSTWTLMQAVKTIMRLNRVD